MNLNDFVWVKLTEYGEEIYKKYHVGGFKVDPPKLEKDRRGWVTFQMWELMKIFGRNCGNGAPNQFEDSIIRFNPPI